MVVCLFGVCVLFCCLLSVRGIWWHLWCFTDLLDCCFALLVVECILLCVWIWFVLNCVCFLFVFGLWVVVLFDALFDFAWVAGCFWFDFDCYCGVCGLFLLISVVTWFVCLFYCLCFDLLWFIVCLMFWFIDLLI